MPIVKTEMGTWVELSEADHKWIAERCNTSASGTVTFTRAAINRYRKLTGQEYEVGWKIRHQMLHEFGEFA